MQSSLPFWHLVATMKLDRDDFERPCAAMDCGSSKRIFAFWVVIA